MYYNGKGVARLVEYGDVINVERYTDIHSRQFDHKRRDKIGESRALLQGTLNATADGIIIVDCREKICNYNCKFIEMWNINEETLLPKEQSGLLGLMLKQLKYPEEYVKKEKEIFIYPARESYDVLELKDGRFIERYSKPQRHNKIIIGRVISFRDITKQKQSEKKMANLERLNVVGEMAAGIGHEVRNPMTTIRGFLQMLINKKECIEYWEYYRLMIEELDRANSIITEFLSLAKDKLTYHQFKNINDVITSLLPLIEADAIIGNKYIRVELSPIPEIYVDETQIRQLILNMVRNGLEAMLTGGYLTIKTYIEKNDVVLAIEDQGTGIIPEVLEKISTPFFTTKKEGTGLGLSICYNIAAHHNAVVDVETSGEGTTFFIRFPMIEAPVIRTN